MQTDSNTQDDLIRLADRYCAGQLVGDELSRMEGYLQKSQHRQMYLEYLEVHAELSLAQPHKVDLGRLLDVTMDDDVRPSRGVPVAWVAAGLTCALGAMLAVGLWSFLSLPSEPTASLSIVSSDAEWEHHSLEPGDILRLGDEVMLKRGTASLAFQTGAIVYLHGPVAIKLTGSNGLRMGYGELHADVPAPARGFVVRTSDAMIVDLGTRFTVVKRPEQGTEVVMEEGRANVQLLDRRGSGVREVDMTAGHAVRFDMRSRISQPLDFLATFRTTTPRINGLLARLTGFIRLVPDVPESLESGSLTTRNYAVVLPEQTVLIEKPLTFEGLEGPVELQQSQLVSSYLVHYDPPANTAVSGAGSVSFHNKILGVLIDTSALLSTDLLFGSGQTVMSVDAHRGLERGNDRFRISEDGRTLTIHFDVDPPVSLDQVRVLIASDQAVDSH